MTALRVILHAPTKAALLRAQSNARNLLAEDPLAKVEIVVNAGAVVPALAMTDAALAGHMVLCQNSLTRQGVQAPPGLRVVDAAVVHIARRQAEGWAYIRA